MMGKRFTLLVFLAVTLTLLQAQPRSDSEQFKVNQAVTMLFDGIAALDMNKMRQSSTSDFLLLEDGEIWNMDTLINKLRPLKSLSFNRINHLEFIRTEVTGTTAWVAYHNAADMTINGRKRNVQWLESAVLVKEGQDWKIKFLHSTVVKPKP